MKRFYHADRCLALAPNQSLILNTHGASVFGCEYWPSMNDRQIEEIDDLDLQREAVLEYVRQSSPYLANTRISRRQVAFAAQSKEDALNFSTLVLPIPEHPIPIYEVSAERYFIADMNWLDFDCKGNVSKMLHYAERYWYGDITNSPYRPPLLEVMLALPITVYQQVGYVENKEGCWQYSPI